MVVSEGADGLDEGSAVRLPGDKAGDKGGDQGGKSGAPGAAGQHKHKQGGANPQ